MLSMFDYAFHAVTNGFALILRILAHNTGGFVLQHHTKWCSSDSVLATAKECESAKAALDPSAPAVHSEEVSGHPKGCSRFEGKWFFNTHAKGQLDGASEPICKTTAGKSQRTCAYT